MADTPRITAIHVQGFRSIAKLELTLRPLNVLIGPNGVGKSNFIDLFGLVRRVITGQLQLYTRQRGGANRVLHYGRKQTAQLDVEILFPPNGYSLSLVPTDEDSFTIAQKVGLFNTGGRNPSPFIEGLTPPGALESRMANPTTRPTAPVARHVYQALHDWRVYHFHDTSRDAAVKQSADRTDSRVLKEDAANLAPFLWRMRDDQPLHYKRLLRIIQRVTPFFLDFYFPDSEDAGDDQSVRLQWQDKNHPDTIFNAHALSDGSLRFICIATLLLQPDLPALVLLDEPELGLHPAAIAIVAGLLGKAAERATIIISTQSVNLVNEFTPEDIIVVERDEEGASTFTRQSADQLAEWLTRYSLGEIWEKNIIGGRP